MNVLCNVSVTRNYSYITYETWKKKDFWSVLKILKSNFFITIPLLFREKRRDIPYYCYTIRVSIREYNTYFKFSTWFFVVREKPSTPGKGESVRNCRSSLDGYTSTRIDYYNILLQVIQLVGVEKVNSVDFTIFTDYWVP